MFKTFLVIAALIGLINQFVLDDALTDWVTNNAEEYWFWGILILVWLIWIIGDKLLKAASFVGDGVLQELNKINSNLDQIREDLGRAERGYGIPIDVRVEQNDLSAEAPAAGHENSSLPPARTKDISGDIHPYFLLG